MIKSFRERPEFVLPDRAMAALPPSRRDPEANERALEGVRADKQVDRQRDDVQVTAADLLDVPSTPGDVT